MSTNTDNNARFLPHVIREHLDEVEVLDRAAQIALLNEVARGHDAAERLAGPAVEPELRRALEAMVRKGGRAKNRLVSSNLRLVAWVAQHQVRRSPWLTKDDLIQEGARGLSHAIDKFDIAKGTALSTYATWWIRQYMSRAIANSGLVRIPVHAQDNAVRRNSPGVRRFDRFESIDEMLAADSTAAQEAGSSDEGWGTEVGSPLAVEAEYEQVDAAMVIAGVLDALTEREAYIIRRRFGFDGEAVTLEEIGEEFGLTRERIRQIEQVAMDKLRRRLGAVPAQFGTAA